MSAKKPPSNVVQLPKRDAIHVAVDAMTKGKGLPGEGQLELIRNARAMLAKIEERNLLRDLIKMQVELVHVASREFKKLGWSQVRADRAALDLVAPLKNRPPEGGE